jgi:protein-L-isoaspartate(D-aspartate) O-methyltransferase
LNFEFARKELTKELSQKGIKDPRVLEAIYQIPRHEFVDATFTSRAYQDMSLPIGHQQTISQPFVVAKMTELLIQGNILEQKPLGAVLEIGTGCGYQTAILARFCRKIFSLERIKALSDRADNNLKKVGVDNYQLRWSDGTLGWPTPKKFDAILCTAAISQIPKKLKAQLELQGKLICPVGDGRKQHLILLEKKSKVEFHETILDSVLFVPMLEGKVSE